MDDIVLRYNQLKAMYDKSQSESLELVGKITLVEYERDSYKERIRLAKDALITQGYFKEDELSNDIAPRITELASHLEQRIAELETDIRNRITFMDNVIEPALCGLRSEIKEARRELAEAKAERDALITSMDTLAQEVFSQIPGEDTQDDEAEHYTELVESFLPNQHDKLLTLGGDLTHLLATDPAPAPSAETERTLVHSLVKVTDENGKERVLFAPYVADVPAAAPAQPEREGLAAALIEWASNPDNVIRWATETVCYCGVCDSDYANNAVNISHRGDCLHVRAQAATRPEETQ